MAPKSRGGDQWPLTGFELKQPLRPATTPETPALARTHPRARTREGLGDPVAAPSACGVPDLTALARALDPGGGPPRPGYGTQSARRGLRPHPRARGAHPPPMMGSARVSCGGGRLFRLLLARQPAAPHRRLRQ